MVPQDGLQVKVNWTGEQFPLIEFAPQGRGSLGGKASKPRMWFEHVTKHPHPHPHRVTQAGENETGMRKAKKG